MLIEDLFKGSSVDVPRMLAHLKEVADSLRLPFGPREKTYNSRLAQELGLWAESLGHGHAFHLAAFHAYFADGKNIADHEVLLDLADASGLDRSEAERVINGRLFRAAVDDDWNLSRQKGVTAVPTFLLNNASLTGARPFNDLLRFVREASQAKS